MHMTVPPLVGVHLPSTWNTCHSLETARTFRTLNSTMISLYMYHGATDHGMEAKPVWTHYAGWRITLTGEGSDIWNDGGRDEERKTMQRVAGWHKGMVQRRNPHTQQEGPEDRGTRRTVVEMTLDTYGQGRIQGDQSGHGPHPVLPWTLALCQQNKKNV